MSKKSKGPYFIKSKYPAREYDRCYDCGRWIGDFGDGYGWWNPNPNAKIRNICEECHTTRDIKKRERWAARLAEIEQLKSEGKWPDANQS